MEYLNNFFENLTSRVANILPGVLGAILVLIIGFLLAKVIKRIAKSLLSKTTLDERLGNDLNSKFRIDDFVAKLIYYIVLLYTLMIVLSMLGVRGVLAPVQSMMNDFLGYLPNIVAAVIIGYAGYMIAKIVSEATGFITKRVERFSEEYKINNSGFNLSDIIKQIVFIFVFIPILIVALDTLKMNAISKPATEMLQSFMGAIPNIIAAAILITVIYFAGKYLVAIGVELLKSLGLDKFAKEVGVDRIIGKRSISSTLGSIALFFIVFTGIIAAVEKLDLFRVGEILNDVLNISGRVFFGMAILFIGVFVANLAIQAVNKKGDNKWLGQIVRFATIGLFLSFALHTMGIADHIVELAFGLTLGSVAVAVALAFGLGGREAAGKQLEHIFKKFRKESE